MTFSEYDRHDGTGLADLVRRREVSPAEVCEAAIACIEARNPRINAVVHRHFDRARAEAARLSDAPPQEDARFLPFLGVPFLLKDLLASDAGTITSQGSRFFADAVASEDSELTRRYKAAGLIIIGKTNTPELGILPVTEPLHHGPTRNPWNLLHTSGGSSGGSAAAVAAGMTPMAHGSDGGGSIRIPASCCGVFGLKPTRGRSPFGPLLGEGWHGIAVEHALTRSVRDSAALLDVIQAPDEGAPYMAPPPPRPFREEVGRDPGRLRIALTTRSLLGTAVDAEVAVRTHEVADLCRRLGHDIEDDRAPALDRHALSRAFLTLVCAEVAAAIREAAALLGRPARAQDFEPATWFLAQIGQVLRADELCSAVHLLHRTGRELARFFRRYDALLTPVLATPPPLIGAMAVRPEELWAMRVFRRLPVGVAMRKALDQIAERAFEFAAFTPLANLTGVPAMSVPLSFTHSGLPLGAHFIGRFGEEATLLRLAAQLEAAQPWAARRPPL